MTSIKENIELAARELYDVGVEVFAAAVELHAESQIDYPTLGQVIAEIEDACPHLARVTLERALARHLIEEGLDDIPHVTEGAGFVPQPVNAFHHHPSP